MCDVLGESVCELVELSECDALGESLPLDEEESVCDAGESVELDEELSPELDDCPSLELELDDELSPELELDDELSPELELDDELSPELELELELELDELSPELCDPTDTGESAVDTFGASTPPTCGNPPLAVGISNPLNFANPPMTGVFPILITRSLTLGSFSAVLIANCPGRSLLATFIATSAPRAAFAAIPPYFPPIAAARTAPPAPPVPTVVITLKPT